MYHDDLELEVMVLESAICKQLAKRHGDLPVEYPQGQAARSTWRWYIRRNLVLLRDLRDKLSKIS